MEYESDLSYTVQEAHSSTSESDDNESYNQYDDLNGGYYNRGSPPDETYLRFQHSVSQSSEDDDTSQAEVKIVDPGPFRYNKRIFITALPCLLLTLAMAGETFLLIVTIGTMLLVLMTHIGESTSRRFVVVFVLLFIPCHILVIVTVFPLVWLSVWNLFLIGLINMFVILTGSWIILQFSAFRIEETELCVIIEQLLFTVYPWLCSALITWVLSYVAPPTVVPFIFLAIWFVFLQLYLLPAVSSFKPSATEFEDSNVLQQPHVISSVIIFIIGGPILHVFITFLNSPSRLGMWSFVTFLLMLTSLGIFLSTLLSLRQVCDYLGWSHKLVVQARWVGGVGATLLCYPVLERLGLVSHFLPWLPVAIAAFAALGLLLAYKFHKMLSWALMAGLLFLFYFWLSRLPWGLQYYFLGVVPINIFYMFVVANFMLCLLIIFTAWHGSKELFSLLVLLQSIGFTICELALYQAGLYSFFVFQLTGIVLAYTLHRLYLADKLARAAATIATSMQLTKSSTGALDLLTGQGGKTGEIAVAEMSFVSFITHMAFIGMLVWLFMYETKEELSLPESAIHLVGLLLCMALSGQSFLLPLGRMLLQSEPTFADIVGLWYGVGGVLLWLYALQNSQIPGLVDHSLKASMVMVGVAALVMILQPQFHWSLFAIFQWSEIFSILVFAGLVTTLAEVTITQIVATAIFLGICPGIRMALLLFGEDSTTLHFSILIPLACVSLAFFIIIIKVQEVNDATENLIKIGFGIVSVLLTALFIVEVMSITSDTSLWDLPVWKLSFGMTVAGAVALKILSMRLGPRQLPVSKKDDTRLSMIPVMGNFVTMAAFLLARTQGPEDAFLHDLWCCASSLLLICLQRDQLLLSALSADNQVAPILMAAVSTLILSTLARCRLWQFDGFLLCLLGIGEILAVLGSLPVYAVLWTITWSGQIWSEKLVVFTMPVNCLVFLFASSFTAWALAGAGTVCGLGMMIYKLPLVPYQP